MDIMIDIKEARDSPPLIEMALQCLNIALHGKCSNKQRRAILNDVFLVPNTSEAFSYIEQVEQSYNGGRKESRPSFSLLEDIRTADGIFETCFWAYYRVIRREEVQYEEDGKIEQQWYAESHLSDYFGRAWKYQGFQPDVLIRVLTRCDGNALCAEALRFKEQNGVPLRDFIAMKFGRPLSSLGRLLYYNSYHFEAWPNIFLYAFDHATRPWDEDAILKRLSSHLEERNKMNFFCSMRRNCK